MHRGVALLAYLFLSLSAGVLGKKPKIEETKFPQLPTNLFYFDDSDVVLVTDPSARTAYRSADAGVKWQKLDGVDEGKVLEVLRHPYNNKVAVVIGLDNKHWITRDQGEKWTSWKCDGAPTLARPAISFHATDPNRMLYMTAECAGLQCNERVWYKIGRAHV